MTPAQVDDLTSGQHTKSRLGTGRAVPVTFQRAALEGVLLAGTDGLFKYASKEVIARIVRAHTIGRTAEELIELAKVASRYGGVYASHMRNEGTELEQAIAETIRVGEMTGGRVEGDVPVTASVRTR